MKFWLGERLWYCGFKNYSIIAMWPGSREVEGIDPKGVSLMWSFIRAYAAANSRACPSLGS